MGVNLEDKEVNYDLLMPGLDFEAYLAANDATVCHVEKPKDAHILIGKPSMKAQLVISHEVVPYLRSIVFKRRKKCSSSKLSVCS